MNVVFTTYKEKSIIVCPDPSSLQLLSGFYGYLCVLDLVPRRSSCKIAITATNEPVQIRRSVGEESQLGTADC